MAELSHFVTVTNELPAPSVNHTWTGEDSRRSELAGMPSAIQHDDLLSSADQKTVYDILADHQQSEDWELRDLLKELQRWAEIMNFEFKLEIPEISLRVDWLRTRVLGHFRYGHNGFGLKGEVAINRRHITEARFWDVLGTLLHELLHAWQQAHGKPGKGNYHNKQFREKAREFGLIVDERGVTQYASESRFKELLRKYGINVPELPRPVLRQRGTSKLKLWWCGCTKIRVAVARFRARCLLCGNEFKRVE